MEPTDLDTSPHPPDESARPTQPRPRKPPTWRALLPFITVGAIVGVIALVALAALIVQLVQTTSVTVILDGEAFQREARADTVSDLLNELGIVLDERDLISASPEAPLEPGMILEINRARGVSLTVDGQTTALWTPLTSPADILANEGISVSELDRILLDGTLAEATELARWPVPVTRLDVRHAVPLHVDDNGERRTIQTTSETVGDALFEAGIPLFLADAISVDLNSPIMANMEVSIQRANPITITTDGTTIETRTQGETTADALADAGIALMGLDYTIPAEDQPLSAGTDVRVVRVKEEVITETQPVPFETVYQADSTLELDQRTVVQEGQEGIQQTITRVRYEDGVEISRSTGDIVTIRPTVNRIVNYGTNVVIRTVDTPDGPRSYWRVLRLYATSYHPAALGGDNITATGQTLVHGIVGADTSVLPFGTEIYIAGYGVGVIADTGPQRLNGMWVDLGYSDDDYQHWSRTVDVYLLTPIPEQINYLLP